MLRAKFGAVGVKTYSVGPPRYPSTWADREDLSQRSGLWQVPVRVVLNEKLDEPSGVINDYLSMALYLTDSGRGNPQIIGEGPASFDAPLILPAGQPTRQSQVPILMYHRVAPYPDPQRYASNYAYRLDYGLTVDPAEFAAQVAYLANNGFVAISLVRLADYLFYGLPLPPKPVVLTFDDGRESVVQYAVPALQRAHFTAVFGVPTGLMGWRNGTQTYISASQAQQLASEGFWFEDHTSKDDIPLWGLPAEQLQTVAGTTRKVLRDVTGDPVQFIVYTGLWPYPSAASSGPAERQVFSALATMGYIGGLLDTRLASARESSDHLWQLPRIRVNPGEDISTFASLL